MSIPLLLQPQSLVGVFEKFANETPSMLLQWFPDRPNAEAGMGIQYDTVSYSRDVAGINVRGGEPQNVKPVARGTVVGQAVTLSEKIYIKPQTVKDLRAAGSNVPAPAAAVVAKEMKNLRLRIGKRKALFAAQCLGTASGNLSFTLPGAAAAETVSLNYRTSSNNHTAIGSAWQTSTTDILANIRTAIASIEQDSGKMATDMVINDVTGAYLTANDNIMDLLSDVAKASVLETGRFQRLCGLNVHYCNESYVNDITGTATKLIPDNHVAILSGDNSDRGMIECAPQSLYAPDGTRGVYFHVVQDPHINGGIWIEYEYNFFPMLACPDDVVYDTTVAA